MSDRLIRYGIIAGPLFVVSSVVLALTRPGFDAVRHPASLLSVGTLGWLQIANFVVCGALFVAAAVGVRQALAGTRAGTWGPILLGAFGVSVVAGGVFVADPALGFPPGTPAGVPAQMSWHAMLHAVAPVTAFLALSLACFVFAWRSIRSGERMWAAVSIATGIGVQILGMLPNVTHDGGTYNFIPLWLAVVLGFGWASIQLARLWQGSTVGR